MGVSKYQHRISWCLFFQKILLWLITIPYFSLVDVACHDIQPSVQISALLALRTLSRQEELRKVGNKNNNILVDMTFKLVSFIMPT